VRASREDLIAMVDGIRNIEIVDDRRVDAGGCVIETNGGTIDAKLDTQLNEIGAALGTMLEEAA
jgi:flagellar assembly protein FliH